MAAPQSYLCPCTPLVRKQVLVNLPLIGHNLFWILQSQLHEIVLSFSPHIVGKPVKVISLRLSLKSHAQVCAGEKSLVMTVKPLAINQTDLKWIGWERNSRGKFGPRFVDVSSDMDPKK